jgi:hypothetical protein
MIVDETSNGSSDAVPAPRRGAIFCVIEEGLSLRTTFLGASYQPRGTTTFFLWNVRANVVERQHKTGPFFSTPSQVFWAMNKGSERSIAPPPGRRHRPCRYFSRSLAQSNSLAVNVSSARAFPA